MNKQELISYIAQQADLTRDNAKGALDALIEGIKSSLSNGQDVRLVGFGTFSVADRPAREGRNPRTGEVIQIAASRQVKFKAGKELKEAAND